MRWRCVVVVVVVVGLLLMTDADAGQWVVKTALWQIVNVVKINFMIILGMTLLINLPLIIQTPMGKFSENSPPSDQTFPNKNFFKQRRSALLENLDLQWEKITIISTQTNTLQIFTIILYFHLVPSVLLSTAYFFKYLCSWGR